jgi:hypothetical protein
MCCFFTALVFLGPRAGILIWWLINPIRWQATFTNFIWPLLGFIFVPWTGRRHRLRLGLDRARRLRGRRYVGGRRDRQPGPHSGLALIVRLDPIPDPPYLEASARSALISR